VQPAALTHLLNHSVPGNHSATEQILPLVYEELRRLASQKMSHERWDHTLQPTALVHEAFLRLVGGESPTVWQNRGHFFAAAAEAMRRILIDDARRRKTLKHGGQQVRLEYSEQLAIADDRETADLLALDEALSRLAVEHPELAELVKLRYFAGLSLEDVAATLGVSSRTVKRHWTYARAWLQREIERT
jgi:RNA polymerase sigma factor (TIGR02999 family)